MTGPVVPREQLAIYDSLLEQAHRRVRSPVEWTLGGDEGQVGFLHTEDSKRSRRT
jgi:hypothetical protein